MYNPFLEDTTEEEQKPRLSNINDLLGLDQQWSDRISEQSGILSKDISEDQKVFGDDMAYGAVLTDYLRSSAPKDTPDEGIIAVREKLFENMSAKDAVTALREEYGVTPEIRAENRGYDNLGNKDGSYWGRNYNPEVFGDRARFKTNLDAQKALGYLTALSNSRRDAEQASLGVKGLGIRDSLNNKNAFLAKNKQDDVLKIEAALRNESPEIVDAVQQGLRIQLGQEFESQVYGFQPVSNDKKEMLRGLLTEITVETKDPNKPESQGVFFGTDFEKKILDGEINDPWERIRYGQYTAHQDQLASRLWMSGKLQDLDNVVERQKIIREAGGKSLSESRIDNWVVGGFQDMMLSVAPMGESIAAGAVGNMVAPLVGTGVSVAYWAAQGQGKILQDYAQMTGKKYSEMDAGELAMVGAASYTAGMAYGAVEFAFGRVGGAQSLMGRSSLSKAISKAGGRFVDRYIADTAMRSAVLKGGVKMATEIFLESVEEFFQEGLTYGTTTGLAGEFDAWETTKRSGKAFLDSLPAVFWMVGVGGGGNVVFEQQNELKATRWAQANITDDLTAAKAIGKRMREAKSPKERVAIVNEEAANHEKEVAQKLLEQETDRKAGFRTGVDGKKLESSDWKMINTKRVREANEWTEKERTDEEIAARLPTDFEFTDLFIKAARGDKQAQNEYNREVIGKGKAPSVLFQSAEPSTQITFSEEEVDETGVVYQDYDQADTASLVDQAANFTTMGIDLGPELSAVIKKRFGKDIGSFNSQVYRVMGQRQVDLTRQAVEKGIRRRVDRETVVPDIARPYMDRGYQIYNQAFSNLEAYLMGLPDSFFYEPTEDWHSGPAAQRGNNAQKEKQKFHEMFRRAVQSGDVAEVQRIINETPINKKGTKLKADGQFARSMVQATRQFAQTKRVIQAQKNVQDNAINKPKIEAIARSMNIPYEQAETTFILGTAMGLPMDRVKWNRDENGSLTISEDSLGQIEGFTIQEQDGKWYAIDRNGNRASRAYESQEAIEQDFEPKATPTDGTYSKEDRAEYDEASAELVRLSSDVGSQEWTDAWQRVENVKNKYGGETPAHRDLLAQEAPTQEAPTYYRGINKNQSNVGDIIHLSPNKSTASRYGEVKKYYVAAKNIFDYENADNVTSLINAIKQNPYEGFNEKSFRRAIESGNFTAFEMPNVVQTIKELGFDSYFNFEGGKNIAIFDKSLIKEATTQQAPKNTEQPLEPPPTLPRPATPGDAKLFVETIGEDKIRETAENPREADLLIRAAQGDAEALKELNIKPEEERFEEPTNESAEREFPSVPIVQKDGVYDPTKSASYNYADEGLRYRGLESSVEVRDAALKEYATAVRNSQIDDLVSSAMEVSRSGEGGIRELAILELAKDDILTNSDRLYTANKNGEIGEAEYLLQKEALDRDISAIKEQTDKVASRSGQNLSLLAFLKEKQVTVETLLGEFVKETGKAPTSEVEKAFEDLARQMRQQAESDKDLGIRMEEDHRQYTEDSIASRIADSKGDADIDLDVLRATVKKLFPNTPEFISNPQSKAIQELVKGYIDNKLITKDNKLKDVLDLLRKDVGDMPNQMFYRALEGIAGKTKERTEQQKAFADIRERAKDHIKIQKAYRKVFDKINSSETASKELAGLRDVLNTLTASDRFQQLSDARKAQHLETISDLMTDLETMTRKVRAYKGAPDAIEKDLKEKIAVLSAERSAQDKYSEVVGKMLSGKLTETKDGSKEALEGEWKKKLVTAQDQLAAAKKQAIKDVLNGKGTEEQKNYLLEVEQKQFDAAMQRLGAVQKMVDEQFRPIKTAKQELSERIDGVNKNISELNRLMNQLDKNADLEQELATKQFKSKWTPPKELSEELAEAQRIGRVLADAKRNIIYHHTEHTRLAKILDKLNILRVLKFTGDISWAQVQLVPIIVSHPIRYVEASKKGIQAFINRDGSVDKGELFGDDATIRTIDQIKANPIFPLYTKRGGVLSDSTKSDYKGLIETTAVDAESHLGLYGKYIVKPSNNSMSVAIDVARFNWFKQSVESGLFPSEAAQKELVRVIGVSTGRGSVDFGSANKNKIANLIFTSAKLMSAAIEYPVLALTVKDKNVRNMVLKDQAKNVSAYVGLLAAWGLMFGMDSVGFDPTDNKTFLKIKIGNAWINPAGPYASIPKIVIRQAWSIGDTEGWWGDGKSRIDLRNDLASFFWYRKSPIMSLAYESVFGKDFLGRDQPRWRAVAESPLAVSGTQSYEIAVNNNANALIKTGLLLDALAGGSIFQEDPTGKPKNAMERTAKKIDRLFGNKPKKSKESSFGDNGFSKKDFKNQF